MVTFLANGYLLELRTPRQGDEEVISAPKLVRKVLSGKYNGYRTGKHRVTLNLDFENVNRPKVLEVIDFLEKTRDFDVAYKDYKNKVWVGRITNDIEATHVKHSNNRFRITFEVRYQ